MLPTFVFVSVQASALAAELREVQQQISVASPIVQSRHSRLPLGGTASRGTSLCAPWD